MKENNTKRKIDFTYAIETLRVRLSSLQATNVRLAQMIVEDPELGQYYHSTLHNNKMAILALYDAIELLEKKAKKCKD